MQQFKIVLLYLFELQAFTSYAGMLKYVFREMRILNPQYFALQLNKNKTAR